MGDNPSNPRKTTTKFLWNSSTIVVTLETIFRQHGDNPREASFHQSLTNIHNAHPLIKDWDLKLMSQCDTCFPLEERPLFNVAVHIFPSNNLVSLHNRKLLKYLNSPIGRFIAEYVHRSYFGRFVDDLLEHEVLLFP